MSKYLRTERKNESTYGLGTGQTVRPLRETFKYAGQLVKQRLFMLDLDCPTANVNLFLSVKTATGVENSP